MRSYEICQIAEEKSNKLRTFAIKIRISQIGYTNIIDTTVQARSPEMARRIIRAQYDNRNVIVGQPRELR